MSNFIAYGVATIFFIAIDFVWLSTMVPRLYRPAMGSLLAEQPNMVAAAIFYLIYPIGLVVFAVNNGVQANSYGQAFLLGALFGGLAYATYDLTNLATLRDWSVQLTIVDICWGALASGAASAAACAVVLKWGSPA
jgi:uncharacterized membrane protein